MKKIVLFPKQTTVWDILEDQKNGILELLIGGGAWGSKTYTWCLRIIVNCLNFPWIRAGIWRSKLKTLRNTTLKTFTKILLNEFWFREWHEYKVTGTNDTKSPNTIQFFNGSEVLLVDLKFYPSLDENFDDLWSLELTIFFCDEVNQITEKAFQVISSRIWRRRNEEYGLKWALLMWCNPAKNRVFREFYKPQMDWTIPAHRKFVQVLAQDNPYCPKAYIEKLLLMPEGPMKQRLAFGNWLYDDNSLKLYKMDDLQSLFTNKGKEGEKYIIADVAWQWKDKTIFFVFEWRKVIDYRIELVSTPESVKAIFQQLWNLHVVKRQNWIYDWSWLWRGLSWLECKIFQWASSPIVDTSASQEEQEATKKAYNNLRSQCFCELAKYIKAWDLSIACDISWSEKDEIIEELDCIQLRKIDNDGPTQIIPKDEIKKLIWRSPDFADVLSMRVRFELWSNGTEPWFW